MYWFTSKCFSKQFLYQVILGPYWVLPSLSALCCCKEPLVWMERLTCIVGPLQLRGVVSTCKSNTSRTWTTVIVYYCRTVLSIHIRQRTYEQGSFYIFLIFVSNGNRTTPPPSFTMVLAFDLGCSSVDINASTPCVLVPFPKKNVLHTDAFSHQSFNAFPFNTTCISVQSTQFFNLFVMLNSNHLQSET